MINKDLYKKAYKEVTEILRYIPKEEFDKIPPYIITNMNKEKDNDYNYQITHFDDFENQEMLTETKTILAVLYRDYWATDYQRERIIAKEKYDINLLEEQKKQEYKTEDLFKNRRKTENINENTEVEEKALVEIKKQNFFVKLILKIKKIITNS